MTRLEAIRKFFNTPGYPEVTSKELLDLGKHDKKALEEIGNLCADALGVEIELPK